MSPTEGVAGASPMTHEGEREPFRAGPSNAHELGKPGKGQGRNPTRLPRMASSSRAPLPGSGGGPGGEVLDEIRRIMEEGETLTYAMDNMMYLSSTRPPRQGRGWEGEG